jgi:hypothetical protein
MNSLLFLGFTYNHNYFLYRRERERFIIGKTGISQILKNRVFPKGFSM